MKKASTLAGIFLITLLVLLSACAGHSDIQLSTLQAYYLDSLHTFDADNGLFIYQSADYAAVTGTESATHDTMSIAMQGTNTGTYHIGPGYTSTMALTVGMRTYSSVNAGSYGTVTLTTLDASKNLAIGTYTGTLYGSSAHDSIQVTQGKISVQYQVD
jgi:hypothetical protein